MQAGKTWARAAKEAETRVVKVPPEEAKVHCLEGVVVEDRHRSHKELIRPDTARVCSRLQTAR